MDYWFHKSVSSKMCPDVTIPLFRNRILTIGWQCIVDDQIMNDIKTAINFDGYAGFKNLIRNTCISLKNISRLYRFLNMKINDIVVVPYNHNGQNDIYFMQVDASAESIINFPFTSFVSNNKFHVVLQNDGLHYAGDLKPIDIGFFIRVKFMKFLPKYDPIIGANFADEIKKFTVGLNRPTNKKIDNNSVKKEINYAYKKAKLLF